MPAKSSGVVMPASTNDTCSVPERWKIWAMFDDVGALLPRRQRLGHPGDGEVDLAVGEHLLRHDVDAGSSIELDVEALSS